MNNLIILERLKRVFFYFDHSSLVDQNLYYCLIADAQGKVIFSDRDISLETAIRALPLPPLLTVCYRNEPNLDKNFPKERGFKFFLADFIARCFSYPPATMEQLDTPEDAYLQIKADYFRNLNLVPYRSKTDGFRLGDEPNFKYLEMELQIDYMIHLHKLMINQLKEQS